MDLFSGAGGFSYGFHRHPRFRVVAAVDIELGKPSLGRGQLGCNSTYEANIGIAPWPLDLATVPAETLRERVTAALGDGGRLDVLIVCPPCTGMTRAVPSNHLTDSPKNALIDRTVEFVRELSPRIVLLENARELLRGRFSSHYDHVRVGLESLGYEVTADVHQLERYGLPQRRERALLVASKKPLTPRSLEDVWDSHRVAEEAVTVERAIGHLSPVDAGESDPTDDAHRAPGFANATTAARIAAIPKSGGSWADLIGGDFEHLLIPSMLRAVEANRINNHGDVYGRMAWSRPAATIKRECSHVGNGRYSHPDQDRLCTLREMSILQGFPSDFVFRGSSLKNLYRHVGNAVPPLIAYQIAHACAWTLGGKQPAVSDVVLPRCHLTSDDLVKTEITS